MVYGPNEDDKLENNKDRFWEELTMAAESAKGELYIAGDFNGRIGKSDELYSVVIGSHGEITINNNGR